MADDATKKLNRISWQMRHTARHGVKPSETVVQGDHYIMSLPKAYKSPDECPECQATLRLIKEYEELNAV